MVRIEVAARARRDERTPVRVEGLDPGAEVTLVARTDGWRGGVESRATFGADDEGSVDTAEQAPVAGTYEEVAPMGWLWSMDDDGGEESGATEDGEQSGATEDDGGGESDATDDDGEGLDATDDRRRDDPVEISLAARVGGDVVATATTVRRHGDPGVEAHPVAADDLAGELFVPPGDGPHPGVLVLHGSGGKSMAPLARLLASHGYAALDLRWFGAEETPTERLANVPLSYFDRAADWLRSHDAVADGPVGVWGASKGGEGALLLGARFDWVGCVVAVAPSGLVFPGRDPGSSTWSWRGDPVPFVPPPSGPDAPEEPPEAFVDRIRVMLEAADEETIEAATIAVERTDAPLLLVSGRDDRLWPATDLAGYAVERLAAHEVAFQYEHLAYDDVGHRVPAPYVPTTGETLGGTPAGTARAAVDYWERTLEYLDRGLGD